MSRLSLGRRSVALFITGALVMALLVTSGVLGWRVRRNWQRDNAQHAAMQTAEDAVPEVLSYNYATLDADLAAARSRLTGDFRTQFNQVANGVVAPTAKRDKVVTTATVTGTSVMSGSGSTVHLLVFVNQSTQSQGKPSLVNTSRVEATMSRVGGHWLISGMRAV